MSERRMKKRFVSNVPILCGKKVALLKGRYRRLIELRYFDEFSYEEIADTLAIPLGTVKAQLFRARELLLNILQHTEIAKEHGKN